MLRRFMILLLVGCAECQLRKTSVAKKLSEISREKVDWEAVKERGLREVQKELERSLDDLVFEVKSVKDVEDFVLELLSQPDHIVFTLNNRLLVSRSLLQIRKNAGHLIFAKSAMDIHPVPNSVYQFVIGASGAGNRFECVKSIAREDDPDETWKHVGSETSEKRDAPYYNRFHKPIPRLCIAKREGYEGCGVLMPNSYVGNITEFATVDAALKKDAITKPFAQRDSRLFWRGHIRGSEHDSKATEYPLRCYKERGNYARLAAASLTSKRPDLFDIRCVDCYPRNAKQDPCKLFPYDDDMQHAFENLEKIRGIHLDHFAFTNYKYFLNLPGSTTGSYSRNLNSAWALSSVVLQWESPHVEWYYPGLTEGLTHLTVNKANVTDVMLALNSDPKLNTRLLRGAKYIEDTFFCPKCFANSFLDIISTWRRKFMLHLLFDNPSLLTNFLKNQVNCTKLDLIDVHYYNERTKTFVGTDLSKLSCSEILEHIRGRTVQKAFQSEIRFPDVRCVPYPLCSQVPEEVLLAEQYDEDIEPQE